MARQRFIWPAIWDDPDLGRLDAEARLLYIGCFSLADDEGRILGDPVYLKTQVFRYRATSPAQVRKMRDRIAAVCKSFCVYEDAQTAYIAFLNWGEFQKPKYPKPSKLPPPPRARNQRKPASESQKSSGNDSGNRSGSDSRSDSGSDSAMGWVGLGSTPLPPTKRKNRRQHGTNPRAQGTAPRQRDDTHTTIDVNDAARRTIAGHGWDDTTDEDSIREELDRLARSPKTTGTLDIDAAIAAWHAERTRRYPDHHADAA